MYNVKFSIWIAIHHLLDHPKGTEARHCSGLVSQKAISIERIYFCSSPGTVQLHLPERTKIHHPARNVEGGIRCTGENCAAEKPRNFTTSAIHTRFSQECEFPISKGSQFSWRTLSSLAKMAFVKLWQRKSLQGTQGFQLLTRRVKHFGNSLIRCIHQYIGGDRSSFSLTEREDIPL